MNLPDPRPLLEKLTDPRRGGKCLLHPLTSILFIVLVATLCGVEDITNMEDWAEINEAWLRQYITLPNGIPSHDTIADVLHRLNPKEFAWMLTEWVEQGLTSLTVEQIALDGKTLRGSRTVNEVVHIVSAYACKGRMVLAQEAVSEKSNEITSALPVLSMLEVEGATITGDAMFCQKDITEFIVASDANYVFSVKDNQPKLHEDLQSSLEGKVLSGELKPLRTLDKDHGRIETRTYYLSSDLDGVRNVKVWHGLAAIGMVESKREIVGKNEAPSVERRYFISTITDLSKFAELVRGHWSIENSQHHVLDVQFHEDENQLSKTAAKNMAVVRRMALNLLRRHPVDKRSLRARKMRAAFDVAYREKVLFGSP